MSGAELKVRLSMASNTQSSEPQRGFTLAGLLVILTVLAVVLAYTVPTMWSDVMRRERDAQTIWVMKQYARAIHEFQRKRGALPVSLEQLIEQNNPRVARALYPNPLTGKVDWILVPPAQGQRGGGNRNRPQNPARPSPHEPPQQQPPLQPPGSSGEQPGSPAGAGKQVGPFIGVRPPVTGQSFLSLNGQTQYESWSFTVMDLQAEIEATTPKAPTNPGNPQQPAPPQRRR